MAERADREEARQFLGPVFKDAVFESMIVSSDSSQFRFLLEGGSAPRYAWVSETSALSLLTGKRCVDNRSRVMAYLHLLLGASVTGIAIEDDGALTIEFEKATVRCALDRVNLETVWWITPDAPGVDEKPRWMISLTDQREIVYTRA